MRTFKTVCFIIGLVGAITPTVAQERNEDESMGDHTERAVTTPLRDLNIDADEIPEKLLEIRENPYSLDGISRCGSIIEEVVALNEVLGPDYGEQVESSKEEKREETVSRIGGGIIGGLIPFRGLVREISGASAKEKEVRDAYIAGAVRRGFLKGMGEQRGCKPPARP